MRNRSVSIMAGGTMQWLNFFPNVLRRVRHLPLWGLGLTLMTAALPLWGRAQSEPQSTLFLPITYGAPPARVLIAAAHIDSAISGEPDEAILLWNVGQDSQALAGWQLETKTRAAAFPITSTLQIAPGQRLWCTGEAAAFRQSFGEEPACEWASDSDPAVLNLTNKLQLTNTRGWIALKNADGKVVDVLRYGDEEQTVDGWTGAPVQPYTRGDVSAAGQVLERKRDPVSGLPVDHDVATDWASDLTDAAWGRRVRMPGWLGWDDATLALPTLANAYATTTVAVGPEGLYAPLAAAFNTAAGSIDLSIYTFEHPQMTAVLVNALGRGVQVRMLLEASPPGGIDDLQRWCLAQLAAAGADIRYLAARDEAPTGYRPRYRFTHAKYGIIDGQRVLLGTENFTTDSMPIPARKPVGGRRGFYLLTDAPPVVQTLQQLFAADWQPERFLDLRPFELTHAKYGGPPDDFVMPEPTQWFVDESPFGEAITAASAGRFAVISAPENALRPDAGIWALIDQANAGDEIDLTQLYEHKYWGDSTSNPIADPNPRLAALIEAARRGARVYLLLDAFFDDSDGLRSNRATVEYITAVASAEGLDLAARLGNPARGGIHAKVVLLRLAGQPWSAVGSLNGGEISHKMNREVVLLTDQPHVYERLFEVFVHDWKVSE
ncbi:MAG: phospholipase D-like domain-containing protein [Caldilineaceae bacterium]